MVRLGQLRATADSISRHLCGRDGINLEATASRLDSLLVRGSRLRQAFGVMANSGRSCRLALPVQQRRFKRLVDPGPKGVDFACHPSYRSRLPALMGCARQLRTPREASL